VEFTYNQLNNFLGSVHQGAADTTSSAMQTIMLYLGQHPEVQEKARLELDRVCGTERMPVWKDFIDLPYINCIVKEGLRIRPLIPAGVPHRARQDDWFDEMLIPKDATILINAYTIHQGMDKDPEVFNPDRYLDRPKLAMDYAGSPDYQNRDHYRYVVRACELFCAAKPYYSTIRVMSYNHLVVIVDRLRTPGRL
jgi:cytochrome P450